jgi:hypothetical protein
MINEGNQPGVEDTEVITQNATGWHLDKRVNVTHILATLGFAFGLASVQWALSERVSLVEASVITNDKITEVKFAAIRETDRQIMLDQTQNYVEILRRLERIEDGVNSHIAASLRNQDNG